jgi:hypothetical protein
MVLRQLQTSSQEEKVRKEQDDLEKKTLPLVWPLGSVANTKWLILEPDSTLNHDFFLIWNRILH